MPTFTWKKHELYSSSTWGKKNMCWSQSQSVYGSREKAGNCTSLLLRPNLVWISLQATPMAKRVSNHAIKAAAAAAARLSVRQIRKWWPPAKTEAKPTMLAINTKKRKISVAALTSKQNRRKRVGQRTCRTILHYYKNDDRFHIKWYIREKMKPLKVPLLVT